MFTRKFLLNPQDSKSELFITCNLLPNAITCIIQYQTNLYDAFYAPIRDTNSGKNLEMFFSQLFEFTKDQQFLSNPSVKLSFNIDPTNPTFNVNLDFVGVINFKCSQRLVPINLLQLNTQ